MTSPDSIPRFFSYSASGGMDLHETLEAARAAAEDELQHQRDYAPDDGWDEDEALSVCYGELRGAAFETERIPWVEYLRRTGHDEEDCAGPHRFYEFVSFDLKEIPSK